MVQFAEELGRRRIDAVAMGHDTHVRQQRYAVGIHEASVEHGYGHATTAIACLVQALQVEHCQLAARVYWHLLQILLHQLVTLRHLHSVGGRKQVGHFGDKRNVAQLPQVVGLRQRHHHGVVPLALAHNAQPTLTELAQIALRHGQVGRVELQPLTAAALQRLHRQELLGSLKREGRTSLVLQLETIKMAGAARKRLALVGCRHMRCQQRQGNGCNDSEC